MTSELSETEARRQLDAAKARLEEVWPQRNEGAEGAAEVQAAVTELNDAIARFIQARNRPS